MESREELGGGEGGGLKVIHDPAIESDWLHSSCVWCSEVVGELSKMQP